MPGAQPLIVDSEIFPRNNPEIPGCPSRKIPAPGCIVILAYFFKFVKVEI
jgi:hypothetical protein